MKGVKVKSQKKRRELRALRREASSAETRINIAIHKRIEELKKDKSFMAKIDKEISHIKTPHDLKRYINSTMNQFEPTNQ